MKGIIFSTEMVRAILEGRKTQTRRVIKPQPSASVMNITLPEHGNGYFEDTPSGRTRILCKCPFGQVGDKLWVRETWHQDTGLCKDQSIHYKADGDNAYSWHPSIFMPRWASRITLEITGVRVERVQELTEKDCYAEGVEFVCVTDKDGHILERITSPAHEDYKPTVGRSLIKAYFAADLWDSLNAKRGYSWESNPWCWCISFKMIDK